MSLWLVPNGCHGYSDKYWWSRRVSYNRLTKFDCIVWYDSCLNSCYTQYQRLFQLQKRRSFLLLFFLLLRESSQQLSFSCQDSLEKILQKITQQLFFSLMALNFTSQLNDHLMDLQKCHQNTILQNFFFLLSPNLNTWFPA